MPRESSRAAPRLASPRAGELAPGRKGRAIDPAPSLDELLLTRSSHGAAAWPVLICVLGGFRVLKAGCALELTSRKTEALLSVLAVNRSQGVGRDVLLDTLWPEVDTRLAGQSLNTLIYGLHKLLGDALGDAAPVLHVGNRYRLNTEAGIGTDVSCFEALADAGDQQARAGHPAGAASWYRRAVRWYGGDLDAGSDLRLVVERERLRARFLALLARLADHHFDQGDYTGALEYALQLLTHDPCREDAHRLVMTCYVRRGERAQALRQYRLCESILRDEFDAAPEPATTALFDQVRLSPDSV